ncbi:MAG: heterocyst frequency control protein PatD [Synechococcales bacterium]|nr:heterocyst frequency control protein PatD [Synechococcales bacterium]
MLPEPYQSRYGALRQSLEQLAGVVADPAGDGDAIERLFQTTQQQAQSVISADFEDLEGAIAPRLRSYRTEINRQLRLLGTDVLFLKTSRQPQTSQQRRAQMGDRLQQLMGYCTASLELGDSTHGDDAP